MLKTTIMLHLLSTEPSFLPHVLDRKVRAASDLILTTISLVASWENGIRLVAHFIEHAIAILGPLLHQGTTYEQKFWLSVSFIQVINLLGCWADLLYNT